MTTFLTHIDFEKKIHKIVYYKQFVIKDTKDNKASFYVKDIVKANDQRFKIGSKGYMCTVTG